MSRFHNQVECGETGNVSNASNSKQHKKTECGPLPGTILRIFLPPGTVINLINLIEIASPTGVCLIVRLPFVGTCPSLNTVIQAVQQAGGTVEFSKS
ncbi:MAG: hypothetical protein PHT78_05735 [Desulfitobacteriaceae bacterium]|nr:hypothetical protein [Desulfitobacteriaceae bacterium]MDD4752743.1 hypothetical protein [Desulfitobacteriaceae bacterium]